MVVESFIIVIYILHYILYTIYISIHNIIRNEKNILYRRSSVVLKRAESSWRVNAKSGRWERITYKYHSKCTNEHIIIYVYCVVCTANTYKSRCLFYKTISLVQWRGLRAGKTIHDSADSEVDECDMFIYIKYRFHIVLRRAMCLELPISSMPLPLPPPFFLSARQG